MSLYIALQDTNSILGNCTKKNENQMKQHFLTFYIFDVKFTSFHLAGL